MISSGVSSLISSGMSSQVSSTGFDSSGVVSIAAGVEGDSLAASDMAV